MHYSGDNRGETKTMADQRPQPPRSSSLSPAVETLLVRGLEEYLGRLIELVEGGRDNNNYGDGKQGTSSTVPTAGNGGLQELAPPPVGSTGSTGPTAWLGNPPPPDTATTHMEQPKQSPPQLARQSPTQLASRGQAATTPVPQATQAAGSGAEKFLRELEQLIKCFLAQTGGDANGGSKPVAPRASSSSRSTQTRTPLPQAHHHSQAMQAAMISQEAATRVEVLRKAVEAAEADAAAKELATVRARSARPSGRQQQQISTTSSNGNVPNNGHSHSILQQIGDQWDAALAENQALRTQLLLASQQQHQDQHSQLLVQENQALRSQLSMADNTTKARSSHQVEQLNQLVQENQALKNQLQGASKQQSHLQKAKESAEQLLQEKNMILNKIRQTIMDLRKELAIHKANMKKGTNTGQGQRVLTTATSAATSRAVQPPQMRASPPVNGGNSRTRAAPSTTRQSAPSPPTQHALAPPPPRQRQVYAPSPASGIHPALLPTLHQEKEELLDKLRHSIADLQSQLVKINGEKQTLEDNLLKTKQMIQTHHDLKHTLEHSFQNAENEVHALRKMLQEVDTDPPVPMSTTTTTTTSRARRSLPQHQQQQQQRQLQHPSTTMALPPPPSAAVAPSRNVMDPVGGGAITSRGLPPRPPPKQQQSTTSTTTTAPQTRHNNRMMVPLAAPNMEDNATPPASNARSSGVVQGMAGGIDAPMGGVEVPTPSSMAAIMPPRQHSMARHHPQILSPSSAASPPKTFRSSPPVSHMAAMDAPVGGVVQLSAKPPPQPQPQHSTAGRLRSPQPQQPNSMLVPHVASRRTPPVSAGAPVAPGAVFRTAPSEINPHHHYHSNHGIVVETVDSEPQMGDDGTYGGNYYQQHLAPWQGSSSHHQEGDLDSKPAAITWEQRTRAAAAPPPAPAPPASIQHHHLTVYNRKPPPAPPQPPQQQHAAGPPTTRKDPKGHNPEWTKSAKHKWDYDPPAEYLASVGMYSEASQYAEPPPQLVEPPAAAAPTADIRPGQTNRGRDSYYGPVSEEGESYYGMVPHPSQQQHEQEHLSSNIDNYYNDPLPQQQQHHAHPSWQSTDSIEEVWNDYHQPPRSVSPGAATNSDFIVQVPNPAPSAAMRMQPGYNGGMAFLQHQMESAVESARYSRSVVVASMQEPTARHPPLPPQQKFPLQPAAPADQNHDVLESTEERIHPELVVPPPQQEASIRPTIPLEYSTLPSQNVVSSGQANYPGQPSFPPLTKPRRNQALPPAPSAWTSTQRQLVRQQQPPPVSSTTNNKMDKDNSLAMALTPPHSNLSRAQQQTGNVRSIHAS